MYKLCKTEQSARRQTEIEEALLTEMLSCRFEDITVIGLCRRMDIPRKAFYRYFDSKEDCLRALVEHTLMSFWEFSKNRSGGSPREMRFEIESFFLFFRENKRLLDALVFSDMLGVLIETSAAAMITTINVSKFLPDEGDSMRQRILQFSICGLMFAMIDWYRSGFNPSVKEMTEAGMRMLSKPLFPNLECVDLY